MKNFIIKTDKFLFGHDAAFYCLIPPLPTVTLISKKGQGNKSLLAHELWHFEQYRKQPFTYAYKMIMNRKFRFENEVECYAKQLLSHENLSLYDKALKLGDYAKFLSENYNLYINRPKAFDALSKRTFLPFKKANNKTYIFKNVVSILVVFCVIWGIL